MEVIRLPLGNKTLEIRPAEGGYDFLIVDGNVAVQALSVMADVRRVCGVSLESYYAKILRDHEDAQVYFREELLSPDTIPNVVMRPDGRLYCRKCNCFVPNTANGEMRKEGVWAHSHVCGIRGAGEVYEETD